MHVGVVALPLLEGHLEMFRFQGSVHELGREEMLACFECCKDFKDRGDRRGRGKHTLVISCDGDGVCYVSGHRVNECVRDSFFGSNLARPFFLLVESVALDDTDNPATCGIGLTAVQLYDSMEAISWLAPHFLPEEVANQNKTEIFITRSSASNQLHVALPEPEPPPYRNHSSKPIKCDGVSKLSGSHNKQEYDTKPNKTPQPEDNTPAHKSTCKDHAHFGGRGGKRPRPPLW